MKSPVLALIALASVSAHAEVKLTPTAYSFLAHGKEAKKLYETLQAAGLQPTKTGSLTIFHLTDLMLTTQTNQALDSTEPCFRKPGYGATFKDEGNKFQAMSLSSDAHGASCGNNAQAESLFEALKPMKIDHLGEQAMGTVYTPGAGVECYYNDRPTPKEAEYTCSGSIGTRAPGR